MSADHVELMLWAFAALCALAGGVLAWMVRDALDSFRSRRYRRIEDQTREAKERVIGISNGAQAEMIRLLMEGRMRRGGG